MAVDLSPERWPTEEKGLAELREQSPFPPSARIVEGQSGVVAATLSPIAVRAGLEALRQGGTAADAAATVALTQVTTALGSYVSFAGILQLLYYDAASEAVTSLNAGWNSYLAEDSPQTIPVSDMGSYGNGRQATQGAEGRKTLVPGFMAGIEAMHNRFGCLPLANLLQPAIYYAENGVTISPLLAVYFGMREKYLNRTLEGRNFLHQAARDCSPKSGDRFVQKELASTLRGVAVDGAKYMYLGNWGRQFVKAVQREGGKVRAEDMDRYAPIWDEPQRSDFMGKTVAAPGKNAGSCKLLHALNLAGELKLDRTAPYFEDWRTFRTLSALLAFAQRAEPGTLSLEERTTKQYAQKMAPAIEEYQDPKHSDSVVVVDRWGNVASLVHTINTVVWGTTGIVVGGIPIPDPANFQQARLAVSKPGARVPNEMTPVIILNVNGDRPTMAIATVGSSLLEETARIIIGMLANRLDLKTAMEAPPLLYNFEAPKAGETDSTKSRFIPAGAYKRDFLEQLQACGVVLEEKSRQQVLSLKGTAVVALIHEQGARSSVETPATSGFASAF